MSHKQKSILIKPQIERVLRQIILKDLSKGRKDFDKAHTEAVVYWMKYLLKTFEEKFGEKKVAKANGQPKFDSQVLITAAYAHDWGYKDLHMARGSEMIEQLLQQRLGKLFTQNQILRVSHLVLFYDKVKKLIDEDEILLMEADTLGMLDTSIVKSTSSKKIGLRLPKFIHEEARQIAKELIEKREKLV